MEKTKAIMHIDSFQDGKLQLSVNDYGVRTLLKGLVDLCKQKYSSYMKLEMSPPYRKRTLSQNDKWWQLCTDLGNALGMTKDEVSMGIKQRAVDEGLWEGVDVPFSITGAKMPKSTTTADTAQMAVLIEVLYRVAAEMEVVLE